jgi:iron complex outermembrane receptor protein
VLARPLAMLLFVCALASAGGHSVSAQTAEPAPSSPVALKKLSLRELMDIEVTSVSRNLTPWSQTAAAVQVITREDIRRSGATTLPEALRLAPNLLVAQVNSHDWAVTARGFNGISVSTGSLADKLLVMIDGRSIYTPLFGGVFWDAQFVPLDEIERIEVVSGPGGTLWGANAVNGIINIITRSAEDSQGGSVTVGLGSFLQKFGEARYGGTLGKDFFYRAYAQYFDADQTTRVTGLNGNDGWSTTQAGFRTDYRRSESDHLTVQGDVYEGNQGEPAATAFVNGQNVLARWTHTDSPDSDWVTQVYYDRTRRRFPTARFQEVLQTFDIDVQRRFPAGEQHSILWGVGYRHMWDSITPGNSFSFVPHQKVMRLFSGFVQDEITPTGTELRLTIGTKFEHNEFSGFEIQPSVRLAWTPTQQQMVWAAASRGVRSPARFDTELKTPTSLGNPDFAAEDVLAYELGYRVSPTEALSLSVAAFHNQYSNIRSFNINPATPGIGIIENDQEVTGFGIELSGAYQAATWWRLRGGYTYQEKEFRLRSTLAIPFSDAFEAQDPQDQIILQSVMDLPRGVQLDVVGRRVAELPPTALNPRIDPYTTADVRLGYTFGRWEVSAVAQNLAGNHAEFSSPILAFEIPRSYHGRLTFAW